MTTTAAAAPETFSLNEIADNVIDAGGGILVEVVEPPKAIKSKPIVAKKPRTPRAEKSAPPKATKKAKSTKAAS